MTQKPGFVPPSYLTMLRDLFAALAPHDSGIRQLDLDEDAEYRYQWADAMLKARVKNEPKSV